MGITGPRVGIGLMLVGAAVFLAWLAGVADVGWQARPDGSGDGGSPLRAGTTVHHISGHPLDVLRLGPAAQVVGFALLVALP